MKRGYRRRCHLKSAGRGESAAAAGGFLRRVVRETYVARFCLASPTKEERVPLAQIANVSDDSLGPTGIAARFFVNSESPSTRDRRVSSRVLAYRLKRATKTSESSVRREWLSIKC
jgi:hypothetical protein